jgi:hypothetical protein
MSEQIIVKMDCDNELPIPNEWRKIIQKIVEEIKNKNYTNLSNLPDVFVSEKDFDGMCSYLDEYGEELISLPEETWNTSVYLWFESHWELMIDLWTVSEGLSDMIIKIEILKIGANYSFKNLMIYVP